MTTVRSVRVEYVRSHRSFELMLSPNVTLITGANGSGKTSLVEALYIALRGSSFRGTDTELLQQGAPWYRIDAEFEGGAMRTVKFDPSRQTGRKQFIIDSKTHYRLTSQHKLPVVLFEPDDLRLLNGSPARRRQFIDTFISQLDPQYGIALRRYERALKQRNSLLKQHPTRDTLFAWDVTLSEHGAYILTQRVKFIEQLDKQLGDEYAAIARTDDHVKIRYSLSPSGNIQQKLLHDLHVHTERDALLGYTSIGPHRHDVLVDFNGSPALSIASRGEVRSIVLALKFLEISIIESVTGKPPIVLLDDVFSELDRHRQTHLTSLTKENQIIITSATNNSAIHTDYVTSL